MKHTLYRIVTKATIFATVFLLTLGTVTPVAYAATAFDDVQLILSRVQVSATPSTTFVIDLPSGVDWDATTASDTIILDLPTGFNLAGTWTSTDFTIVDDLGVAGRNYIVSTTDSNLTQSATAGTYSFLTVCVGSQNAGFVQIAVNTEDEAIRLRRCGVSGEATPVGSGGEIRITLQNKSSGGGTFTLPAAVKSGTDAIVEITLNDEATPTVYSDRLAISTISIDSSGPSAPTPAAPTMTFELSQDKTAVGTALAACDAGVAYASGGPVIGFDTPMSITKINNATSTICTSVTSTAGSIATIYAYSLYGGLTSDSGATYILAAGTHTSGGEVTFAADTTRDDGVCVLGSSDTGIGSGVSGNVTSTDNYGGNCDWTSSDSGTQQFGQLTKITLGMQALWSANMTSAGAFAHILPRVGLTSAVASGTYSDTQYFVAASAF